MSVISNTKASELIGSDLKIIVIGVGGAGGNAVNNMIRSKLLGVEFVVCNTDAQALNQSLVDPASRIQLGHRVTQGLGAGSRPEVGRAAAEESLEQILDKIEGSNMVFVTAGMGGGSGTGAAPVIAQAAREQGILTVAVVTKPFHFEGKHRMRTAENGIEELEQYVDTLIVIPNQNLFRIATEKTTFADAFRLADDVLYSGVRGVTDLIMRPGLINLDFADIRAVMMEMGKAMMGTGSAGGDKRAIEAAEAAISNPLLDDISVKGARGVLINITGGPDMTLFEVDEAANRVREEVDPDANIIVGSTLDESMEGHLRVSVVATGIAQDVAQARQKQQAVEHREIIEEVAVNARASSQTRRSESVPGLMPRGFFGRPRRDSQERTALQQHMPQDGDVFSANYQTEPDSGDFSSDIQGGSGRESAVHGDEAHLTGGVDAVRSQEQEALFQQDDTQSSVPLSGERPLRKSGFFARVTEAWGGRGSSGAGNAPSNPHIQNANGDSSINRWNNIASHPYQAQMPDRDETPLKHGNSSEGSSSAVPSADHVEVYSHHDPVAHEQNTLEIPAFLRRRANNR